MSITLKYHAKSALIPKSLIWGIKRVVKLYIKAIYYANCLIGNEL